MFQLAHASCKNFSKDMKTKSTSLPLPTQDILFPLFPLTSFLLVSYSSFHPSTALIHTQPHLKKFLFLFFYNQNNHNHALQIIMFFSPSSPVDKNHTHHPHVKTIILQQSQSQPPPPLYQKV